jgi:transcriptional regulator with XRE-family HTH domain
MTRNERRERALQRLQERTATEPRVRLRDLREASGIGEEALAKRCFGVSGPTVHDWEHGRRAPTEENRRKIEAWSIERIRELGVDVRPIFATDWPHAVGAPSPEAP